MTEHRRMRRTPYYKVGEVAELLGYDPATIRRWIRSGDLPAIRPGHRGEYRIPADVVDRIMSGDLGNLKSRCFANAPGDSAGQAS